MDADGQHLERLTDDPASDFDPTWSDDGRQIAWRTNRVGGEDEIFVMDADGSNERNLTSNPNEDYAPDWSPDGRLIAYDSDLHSLPVIRVVAPDGSGARVLDIDPTGEYASWSPDGSRLAYTVNSGVVPGLPAGAGWDLYLGNVDGSGTTRLTSRSSDEKAPSWSPNGDEIAFELQAGDSSNPDIWVISADGASLRRLTWRVGYTPAWSPDGMYIVFATGGGLAVISTDGTRRADLPLAGLVEPVLPDWTTSG